ncbi:MAG: hypothetical protein ABSE18_04390 [Minisyncoccia bacterium]|jgi:hypothetical protein
MRQPQNPEEVFFRNESREALSDVQEALYNFLVPEMKAKAVNLDDFLNVPGYKQSEITDDKALVKKLTDRFAARERGSEAMHVAKKRNDLLEAIVNNGIAESDWMGGRANFFVPSRFDDFIHHIDGIVEFEREEEEKEGKFLHLALGIDATGNDKDLEEKFDAVTNSIITESLSTVKYFKSENLCEPLTLLPRVVVGADKEVVDSIAGLLLRFRRLKETISAGRREKERSASVQGAIKEFTKVRDEIAEHPFQAILLTEIKVQLESFLRYAQAKEKYEAASRYAQVLAVIYRVMSEKGAAINKLDEKSKQDIIYQMILEKSARFGEKSGLVEKIPLTRQQ